MLIRRTQPEDVKEIMQIINQAINYLAANSINQWQNGYPNQQTIENDLNNGQSYVVQAEKKIIGTAALIIGEEPSYNRIYKGEWLDSGEYLTIHRIAVDNAYKGQGIAKAIIEYAGALAKQSNVKSIRIDTHSDNLNMQKFLIKNGFKYTGIIYLKDGNKRLAYQKLLSI